MAAAKQRAHRSLVRRRVGAATLSAGMVVAAVIAATLAGASSGPASRPGPTSQTSLQSPGPLTFDVAASRLNFAWLPRGVRVGTQTSSATLLSAGLAAQATWTVSVLAAGQCQLSNGTLRCQGQVVAWPAQRAPEVNGGVAYWGTYAPNNFASLSFEYAADSWANIVYWTGRSTGTFTHGSRGEILRIARGLTLTRGAPVLLPVRLEGLSGWKLTYTQWTWSASSGGSVIATFSPAANATRSRYGLGAGAANPSVVIRPASPRNTCDVYPPSQHLTINGDSVVIEGQAVYPPGGPQDGQAPERESQTLCAANAGGLMIFLTVTGTHPPSLTNLFSHLRPLREASSWTGEPAG